MSETAILINTAVAILAIVLLIVRFKFNPVISLVLGSLYLGLSTGLGIDKTIETITGGFGEIMAEVGLLIAFGVLMGAMLQEMGAIQRLVEHLLRVFGPKLMPYALSLTIATALQSIFLDVLLVISAPLARDLAQKIGKNGTARWPPPWPSAWSAESSSWFPALARSPWPACSVFPWARCCSAASRWSFPPSLSSDHHVVPLQPRLVESGARRTDLFDEGFPKPSRTGRPRR